MKKKLLIVVFSVITSAIFFVSLSQKSDAAVDNVNYSTTKKEKVVENKTIAAAVSEFKDKDIEYVQDYFANTDKDTKVLAVKENNGYGFLSGESTTQDANGNIIEHDNADTDSNAAEVGDIISAVSSAQQNN